jgi:hypothetical protein
MTTCKVPGWHQGGQTRWPNEDRPTSGRLACTGAALPDRAGIPVASAVALRPAREKAPEIRVRGGVDR